MFAFPTWSVSRLLRAVVLLLLLSTAGIALAAEPFAGVDAKWRHFRSPNFELYSRVAEGESRAVLRQLEVLRAMFLQTLRLEERAPAPVTIFYFNNVRDYRTYLRAEYRKNENYRASFHSDPDRGLMLLAPLDSAKFGHELALSSYIRHLFRTAGERPPTWIGTGFAQLFQTLEIVGDRVIFGRPSTGKVHVLREKQLMPLESLLGIEPGNELFAEEEATSLYFAQTWAIIHYWMLGKHNLPQERVDAFLRYARRQRDASPEERRQAFERFFGMDYAAMNKAVDSYIYSGRYSYAKLTIPDVPPADSYARRTVPRDEIQLELAGVALRTTRDPAGRLALLHALSTNPADIRVLEALGAVAMDERDMNVARERWARALEAGSTNPAIIQHLAQLETRGWFQQFDYYFRLPVEKADRLRDLLQRSIAVAPAQSEAYEMLAWTEACAPDPSVANINLVQKKFSTLDDRAHTLLALALVRLRLGDREGGLKLLDDIDKLEPSSRTQQAAEVTRAILEGRPPKRLTEKPEQTIRMEFGKPQFNQP